MFGIHAPHPFTWIVWTLCVEDKIERKYQLTYIEVVVCCVSRAIRRLVV